jgi:hypothetical protein
MSLLTLSKSKAKLNARRSFKFHGGVAKVIESQFVEVVLSNSDIEMLSPIVIDALVQDGATGIDGFHAVRAGSKRRLQRRVADLPPVPGLVSRLPPVFWQHRKLPNDLRVRLIMYPGRIMLWRVCARAT